MSDMLKQLSDAMAEATANASASLVSVEGRRRLPATGIIHSADGIIVTAHHILERDEDITVVLADGERVSAVLIGRDPANDLAVLRAQKSDLTPATWGDNGALRIGNLVLALGKPGEQVQATLGVVSALVSGAARVERRKRMEKRGGGRGRRMMERMNQFLADGFIQTDVVMYPGFSGGPLMSGDGAFHGMNTSGFGRGASVAVPVTTISNTIDTLLKHGRMRQGYLGVGVQPVRVPENIASSRDQDTGLLVVSVESGSPAAQAGVLVGDIVVSLGGESVEALEELLSLLQGERVGQSVALGMVRGGEYREVEVTIAERM